MGLKKQKLSYITLICSLSECPEHGHLREFRTLASFLKDVG